jgi:hypothetical protein
VTTITALAVLIADLFLTGPDRDAARVAVDPSASILTPCEVPAIFGAPGENARQSPSSSTTTRCSLTCCSAPPAAQYVDGSRLSDDDVGRAGEYYAPRVVRDRRDDDDGRGGGSGSSSFWSRGHVDLAVTCSPAWRQDVRSNDRAPSTSCSAPSPRLSLFGIALVYGVTASTRLDAIATHRPSGEQAARCCCSASRF